MSQQTTYHFRIRFDLADRIRLNDKNAKVLVSKPGAQPEVIMKVAEKDKAFENARRLAIIGGPYLTEEHALNSADEWRTLAEASFAYMGIAADFGDRSHVSTFTEHGLQMVSKQEGRRVLNDEHGIMTYQSLPEPLFAYANIDIKVGIPLDLTLSTLQHAASLNLASSPSERLAYDLYSISFSQPAADARFLTLMMAVETLATRKKRVKSSIDHIDKLIKETTDSPLSDEEKSSIKSALSDLKSQSISSACAELAKLVSDIEYGGVDSVTFIRNCYKVRSMLVHGSNPRPTLQAVNELAAPLEIFVSHLLSQKLNIPFRATGATSDSGRSKSEEM